MNENRSFILIHRRQVKQLTSQDVLSAECDQKMICFVAFVPHILDSKAKGRNALIDTLKALANRFKVWRKRERE